MYNELVKCTRLPTWDDKKGLWKLEFRMLYFANNTNDSMIQWWNMLEEDTRCKGKRKCNAFQNITSFPAHLKIILYVTLFYTV